MVADVNTLEGKVRSNFAIWGKIKETRDYLKEKSRTYLKDNWKTVVAGITFIGLATGVGYNLIKGPTLEDYLYTANNRGDKTRELTSGELCARVALEGYANNGAGSGSIDLHLSKNGEIVYSANEVPINSEGVACADISGEEIERDNYSVIVMHPTHLNINSKYPQNIGSVGENEIVNLDNPDHVACGEDVLEDLGGGVWGARAGDANRDGVVNVFDFNDMGQNWGTSNPSSDYNDDGTINVFDFNLLGRNWGGSECGEEINECENPYCITENYDFEKEWGDFCPQSSLQQCECIEDYINFPGIAQNFSHPINEEQLQQQIEAILAGNVEQFFFPLPQDELKEILIDNLNIRFLRENINQRPLEVTTIFETEEQEYFERHLEFNDPYIGRFNAILLSSKLQGVHPAVIATPGHVDSAMGFKDDFLGERYPEQEYSLLIIQPRGLCGFPYETQVARTLLLNGFTLIGLKHYETILAGKYLKYLGVENIGITGHSSGSTLLNTIIRIEEDFDAAISDHFSTYSVGGNPPDPSIIMDSTIPQIWPYGPLINDFSTSPVPILNIPYGDFREEEVFPFFDQHLKDNKSSKDTSFLYDPRGRKIKDSSKIGEIYDARRRRINNVEKVLGLYDAEGREIADASKVGYICDARGKRVSPSNLSA